MNSDHRNGPIERCLRAVRTHLGLDVAFVGEFVDGQRVFRYVDAADESCVVTVGGSDRLEDSYCLYVADGRLPGFLRDPAAHPVSARLPATDDMPVGTHLSVPIRLVDGRLYGTFCCFSFQVHDRLDERDLAAVEMLAAVVAGYLEEQQADRARADQARQRIRAILDGQEPTAALQPIVDLATGDVVGVEALSRFPIAGRAPGPVFTEAWACGLGEPLELKAVRVALGCLADLPAPAYLAINASPATVVSESFQAAVSVMDTRRVVIEVTEHEAVHDYERWLRSARALSDLGVRLAVDDVGTGFSGLHHILRVRPDILKIDQALVRKVNADPAKRALISALVSFAPEVGSVIVAEGVERVQEAACLRELGVQCAQGFHFGRPKIAH